MLTQKLRLINVTVWTLSNGQIHKYFYRVNICARNGCKKSLGGIIGGTLGIKKNAIPAPLPRAYGRDNGFCTKSPFSYRKPYKTT